MIIQTDCRDIDLDLLSSCDTLITDPPFSPHVHESATSTRTGGVGPVARDLGFEALSPELRDWIALAASTVSGWSVIFSDFEGVHAWREACLAADLEWIRLVPWVRWSQPQISGDRPPTGAEAVLHFHATSPKGRPIRKTWNGPGGLTHYDARCMRGRDKHPTEKPLDLALSLVSYYSQPGHVVLDPCAGAGTVGLACRLLEREHVGCELDPRWARYAADRETAPLSPRDLQRVRDWLAASEDDVVPEPTCDAERPTYERFLRRREDRDRVRRNVGVSK